MARKKRTDSAVAQVEAMRKAARKIEPPAYINLEDEALPFWDAVISMRGEWLENDLILAAQLARVYLDIEYYTQLARKGMRVDLSGEKTDVAAAHKILKDLNADALRICRTLQIHPRATQGESRDQVKRNELHREAKDTINSLSALIARPQ